MISYYLVAILSVLFASIAQILLKLGANAIHKRGRMSDIYFNGRTAIGAILFILVTLLSIFALQKIYLKELVFILPMSYIFVPILARIFLNERMTIRRIVGILVILLGMVVFNLDKFLK